MITEHQQPPAIKTLSDLDLPVSGKKMPLSIHLPKLSFYFTQTCQNNVVNKDLMKAHISFIILLLIIKIVELSCLFNVSFINIKC